MRDNKSNHRSSRITFALAYALMAVLSSASITSAQPNVLLITLDDLNYNSAGVTGCTMPNITPNIDALASEGMRFEHAHVTTAICQPCRSALMTGRYGHRSGAIGFSDRPPPHIPYGDVNADVPTLIEELDAAGYYTGELGKETHLTPSSKFPWDVVVAGTKESDPLVKGRDSQAYYDYAKSFIEASQQAGKPFFLMANSHDPHRPFIDEYVCCDSYMPEYCTPGEVEIPGFLHFERDLPDIVEEMSRYYCSAHRADQTVGKILQALDDTGGTNNTLVMFISDHGMSNPYAKANVYLNSTKTPWIVRWPGVVTPGTVDYEHMISGIDYMPTILEALGLPQVSDMDGTSFYPVLTGGSQPERDRVYTTFYINWEEVYYPMRSLQGKKYGYIYNDWYGGTYYNNESMDQGLTWPAMVLYASVHPNSDVADRVNFFKYRAQEELYDYEVDPDALNNLIDNPQYASVLEQYRQEMLAMMQTSEDPLEIKYQSYLASLPQTTPPAITLHPSNQAPCVGSSANFMVSSSGSSPLSYQWQKNQSDLSNGGHYSGCTTYTLTVSSADSGDVANYRCVVTNPNGSATSNEASLTLTTVNITQQPAGQSICTGASAQFTVAATGDGSLNYQWQKNLVNLSNGGHYSGVTTATLTISNADSGDEADYRCKITDNMSGTYSDEAALAVNACVLITKQPANHIIQEGDTAVFSVTATGSGPLAYQWQKNLVNLSNGGHYSGVTTSVLTVSNADSGDEANYRCVVTDVYGTATSNEAALVLVSPGPPIITQHPVNQQTIVGGVTDFMIVAVSTLPISYQWQKNLSDLSNGGHFAGVKTPTLTISSADANDEANYRCIATNTYGSVNSNSASLTMTECTTPELLNGGFENIGTGGIAANWTGYARTVVPANVNYSQQFDMEVEGLLCQQIETSYVASGGAGVYQTITGCISGATYNISGWMKTNSTNCRATVKCTPDGSTSYDGTVSLFPTATTTSMSWVPFSGRVIATATHMTLFLDSQTYVSGAPNLAARFDGLTMACSTPLPRPAEYGDYDADGDVDSTDIDTFIGCFTGPTISYAGDCEKADFDQDNDVDQNDFGVFQRCYSGENNTPDPTCAE